MGRALTEHPDVAKVTFTGSVNVGRQVMRQAAAGLRSVVLELGGKSAAIMLPGVDFDKYALSLHTRYARDAGQGSARRRGILVEESRYEEFCEISRKVYPQVKVGDPNDPATIVGPVVTSAQRDRIEAGVARAVEAGAKIIAGGGRPDIAKGWFLNPALVGAIDNDANLAREEIFGPVSVVLDVSHCRRGDPDRQRFRARAEGLYIRREGRVPEARARAPRGNRADQRRQPAATRRPDDRLEAQRVGAEWGEDGLRDPRTAEHIDCPLN